MLCSINSSPMGNPARAKLSTLALKMECAWRMCVQGSIVLRKQSSVFLDSSAEISIRNQGLDERLSLGFVSCVSRAVD